VRRGLFLIAQLALLFALSHPARAENPYGVMMWPVAGFQDFSVALARSAGLGVAWFRPTNVYIDRLPKSGACSECTALLRSPLRLALTVRNAPGAGRPSTPPSDMEDYKRRLGTILDLWKPQLLVVEQEEDLPATYSALDVSKAYAQQLEAACQVAHARSILCTNGGLSYEATSVLIWLAFADRGKMEQACAYARGTLYQKGRPDAGAILCPKGGQILIDSKARSDQLALARKLLDVYKKSPIDAVNFHWYGHDAGTLSETVDMLKRLTSKPVLSNEMGQRPWDAEPGRVRALLRAAFASQMVTAIWLSMDTQNTVSLFDEDGSLRPAGKEFAHQMSGRK